jgi:hypothetical protein
VVRDGEAAIIPAAEVVRGDLLLLEAGDLVAADARPVETAALRTSEAPLTGESEPVEKHTGTCASETPLADRRNMVFLLGTEPISLLQCVAWIGLGSLPLITLESLKRFPKTRGPRRQGVGSKGSLNASTPAVEGLRVRHRRNGR